MDKIVSRFWWPGLAKDVISFVKDCAQCQKSKKPSNFSAVRPLHPLPPPDKPNDRVHADLFGPLPSSPSGNKWILTLTCAFSKFVRVLPLPNKEASTVASAILRHWVAVFGPMGRLVHDQGREFHNVLLRDLLNWLGVHQRTTSAMAPSVNGEAEIFNKWIASYLKTVSFRPNEDWEGHLAALNLAYNSTTHASIRTQPTFVMFGRPPKLPHLDPTPPGPSTDSWADQQRSLFQSIWPKVQEELRVTGQRMQLSQTRTRSFSPSQGERVLLFYPCTALAARGPPKLQQQWVDAVVLAQVGPATFLVRPLRPGQHASLVHGNRLKPFLPRTTLPARLWCSDKPLPPPQDNAPAATRMPAAMRARARRRYHCCYLPLRPPLPCVRTLRYAEAPACKLSRRARLHPSFTLPRARFNARAYCRPLCALAPVTAGAVSETKRRKSKARHCAKIGQFRFGRRTRRSIPIIITDTCGHQHLLRSLLLLLLLPRHPTRHRRRPRRTTIGSVPHLPPRITFRPTKIFLPSETPSPDYSVTGSRQLQVQTRPSLSHAGALRVPRHGTVLPFPSAVWPRTWQAGSTRSCRRAGGG